MAVTCDQTGAAGLEDEGLRAPIYRVVDRRLWVGTKHTTLYGQLRALYEHWRASYIVVDGTGVGAGLCSFLEKHLGNKVIRYEFNGSTKRKLGWEFLAVIETGGFRDWRESTLTPGPSPWMYRLERWVTIVRTHG